MTVQALTTGPETQADGSPGPVLSLEHISKTYPGTRALADVSFDLSAGEVHCLVGENGAGKSTLMKILAGVVQPDQGAIILRGAAHQHLTPRSALRLGVSTIYQESDIVSSLTVADNVFLGQEPVRAIDVVDTNQQRRVTQEIIEDLGVDLDPDELGSRLSPAQRQLTMIVRALRFAPDVLILDEPTSSLGQAETEHLLSLVRRLAQRGIGIVYISHYLEEVLRVADRITVLKDGQHVATLPAPKRPQMGSSISWWDGTHQRSSSRRPSPSARSSCASRTTSDRGCRNRSRWRCTGARHSVSAAWWVPDGPSFSSCSSACEKPRSGTIYIDGRASRPRSPREAVAAGLSLVTEDRARSGLFPDRTVRENLATAWNELRGAVVRGERGLADGIVERLGIVTPSIEQEVKRLSGGNQQKVLIGRWLAVDAQVYMFDEPTKGVDIGAKHDIYGFIAELLKAGRAVIIVSSDLPELLSISDRIAIMRHGRIISTVAAEEATEQSLMKEFLGVTGD